MRLLTAGKTIQAEEVLEFIMFIESRVESLPIDICECKSLMALLQESRPKCDMPHIEVALYLQVN